MVKGYFLSYYLDIQNELSGIAEKIRSQIRMMNEANIQCEPYQQPSGREHLPKLLGKILYYLPFSNVNPKWYYDSCFDHADFLYFRRPIAMTYSMRRFLRECKKRNPAIKIFIDIPTYPYDKEFKKGLLGKYTYLRDKINRKYLSGLVDCFFVIDPMKLAEQINGIRTVHFLNGYDVKHSAKRTYIPHKSINLICVGMFNFWHGYERLLEGLALYQSHGGKRKIHIDMVGGGVELPHYQEIVRNRKLEDSVTFHGPLFGKELDALYSVADIGISSLGRYKNDIQILGDLKTREYLTKGIPVVSGCTVDIFENRQFDYYLEIENNANPVDIDKILSFYDFIQKQREQTDIEEVLHRFSLETFDISQTMKPVIREILEQTKT